MAANLRDRLVEKVKSLPIEKQREALELLDRLSANGEALPVAPGHPVWKVVESINDTLPADTWDDVPTDGSANLDHYLYGAPKLPS